MLASLSYLNHKTIGVRGRELGGWVTAMVAGWLAFGTGEAGGVQVGAHHRRT